MKPVVDRLEKEYKGKVEIKRYNVEKDEQGQALAAQYQAQYVPTFVFLNSDGNVAQMKVGEIEEAEIRSILDSLN